MSIRFVLIIIIKKISKYLLKSLVIFYSKNNTTICKSLKKIKFIILYI